MPDGPANIELVRRIYELQARGETEQALSYLAPDIEWIEPAENPDASERVGRDQARDAHAEWSSTWGQMTIDVLALTASGERVLAHLQFEVQGAGSGIPTNFEQYQVWTVRDGKATRLEMIYDGGEAKRAAGIETTPIEEPK